MKMWNLYKQGRRFFPKILPLTETALSYTRSAPSEFSFSRSLQILVVDDHYANRLLAKTLLERQGHDVILATTGQEAITLCNYQAFDLILIDIQMPDMDGITTYKHIRQSDTPNQTTPIFAVTAYSSPEEQRFYKLNGLRTILTKPLKPGDVKAAWLSHTQMHTENAAQVSTNFAQTPRIKKIAPPSKNLIGKTQHHPLIDKNITQRIIAASSVQMRETILEKFWDDLGLLLKNMDILIASIQAQDMRALDALRRDAHAIKGGTINIGILRASRIAAKLQNAPVQDIPNLFGELKHCLAETAPIIDRELSA